MSLTVAPSRQAVALAAATFAAAIGGGATDAGARLRATGQTASLGEAPQASATRPVRAPAIDRTAVRFSS